MLDAEQMENWLDSQADAINAARMFAERARRGLPADRLATGTDGEKLVAQGIVALGALVDFQSNLIEAMTKAIIAAGAESMGLGRGD